MPILNPENYADFSQQEKAYFNKLLIEMPETRALEGNYQNVILNSRIYFKDEYPLQIEQYWIFRRPSSRFPDQYRYHLLGKTLGLGDFGSVHYSNLVFKPIQNAVFPEQSFQLFTKKNPYAVKYFKLRYDNPYFLDSIKREGQLLSLHINNKLGKNPVEIIKNKSAFLCLPFVKGNTLLDQPNQTQLMPWPETITICYQFINELNNFHQQKSLPNTKDPETRDNFRFAHCDVKPANYIYYPPTCETKLVDMGLAINLTTQESFHGHGSTVFAAPQATNSHNNHRFWGRKHDAFALGASIASQIIGNASQTPRLNAGKYANPYEINQRIKNTPYNLTPLYESRPHLSIKLQQYFIDMLKALMNDNPRSRPSLKKVKEELRSNLHSHATINEKYLLSLIGCLTPLNKDPDIALLLLHLSNLQTKTDFEWLQAYTFSYRCSQTIIKSITKTTTDPLPILRALKDFIRNYCCESPKIVDDEAAQFGL